MSLTLGALRELVGFGLTAEQILAVAEAQGVAPKRSSGAERQARYRAKNNDVTSNVTSDASPDDVTSLSGGSEGFPKPLPTPPNLSKEPPISPTKRASKASTSAAFDQFWAAYPRKVAKGRAEKAFPQALVLASLETLIAGALATGRRHDDAKFIPHPASWLNDKRWLDTDDPPKGASATIVDADHVARRREENRRLYEDAS